MTKLWNGCGSYKVLSLFPTDKRKLLGVASKCKDCYYIQIQKWQKTPKGWASAVYTNQCNNSRRRGHPKPTYSRVQLLNWAQFNGLDLLLVRWSEYGYAQKERPSVDRLSETEGYTLDNIQLVTWDENHTKNSIEVINGKSTPRTKPVRQLTLQGESIAEFYNIREASRKTGIRSSAISNVCVGRKNKTGGFRWEHIN